MSSLADAAIENSMGEQFLDSRDHIDVHALVARLRARADGRGAASEGLPRVPTTDDPETRSRIAKALAGQAELNHLVANIAITIGQAVRSLEAEMAALERRLAFEEKERHPAPAKHARLPAVLHPAHDSAIGTNGRSSSSELQAVRDLDVLRASLHMSLASVEALISQRNGTDQ